MASFRLFLLLPFELRAEIGELTVEPRVVEARVCHLRLPRHSKRLKSPTPMPAPLQTCHKARNMKLYQQVVSEIDNDRYIWANLDIDIISMRTDKFCWFVPVSPLIKRLRFEREHSSEAAGLSFYHFEVEELIKSEWANVKEIHAVCADCMWNWHGATQDHYWPCGNTRRPLVCLLELRRANAAV